MSLLSRLNAGLKAFVQNSEGNTLFEALFQYIRSGQIVLPKDDPKTYIDAYGRNPNLATVVDLRSSNAASIDVELIEIDSKGDETLIEEHEILDVYNHPNQFQTGKDLVELQTKFDLLTGNIYYYSPRPDTGNNIGRIPKDEDGNYQLFAMPPQITEIQSGGALQPIQKYKFKGNYKLKVDPFEVLHIKRGNTDVDDKYLYGGSPAKTIRSTLAISNMANNAQYSSFKNGGVNGIVTFKNASGTPERATALKEQFEKENEGESKIGKVYATSAEVDYLNMGRSNVELAVLESEIQSLRKIASHYFIDPGLVGDPAGSTFSNRKDARKAAYTDAYIPSLVRILQGLNEWLCPYYAAEGKRLELRPKLDNIPELQPDMVELWTWLNAAYPLSPNQKLRIAGFEESEDERMDIPLFPANLFPLGDDFSEEDINKFLTEQGINDYGKNGKSKADAEKIIKQLTQYVNSG